MVVPSPSPTPSAKAVLRAEMRQRRREYAASLDPETRAALEAEVARLLEPLLFGAQVIAGYQPMKEELSPLPALALARTLGKIVALPAFAARDSRMTFREGEGSEAGPWGLLQPPLSSPPVEPDLVLVPLVACDRRGNRIGMGQGHYDRALDGLRAKARLVGIGWHFQLLDRALEPDPWDQKLDAFVSPAGLQEFNHGA
nr:5-formyltetrahydrofolate cyclo-ligase [Sphingomonas sp. LHG3406-1]